jgi:hypothetical protein
MPSTKRTFSASPMGSGPGRSPHHALDALYTGLLTRKVNWVLDLEIHGFLDPRAFAEYLAPLRQTEWVVYSKPPFGGPEQVLNYLDRYTHRVAISNNRLLDIADGRVTFRWKDYRHHDRQKTMALAADEFIRRFSLHVLPDGFQRIRHYGFLGHRYRHAKLALCRQLLGVVLTMTGVVPPPDKPDYRDVYEKLTGKSLRECPVCHRGQMVTIAVLSAPDRAPPFANR